MLHTQLSFIDFLFYMYKKIRFHLLYVAVDCVNVGKIITETDASGVYDCQIVYMKEKRNK